MGSPALDERVSALPAAIDPVLREEIQQSLQILRELQNPVAVLLTLSRIALRLMRIIYQAAGHQPPSDNLYDCLTLAGRGEPGQKSKGLGFLPDEIASCLHTVRILSNKADHAQERVALTLHDAENGLNLLLRAVDWFYCEASFGAKIQARSLRTRARSRRLFVAIPVVILGFTLAGYLGLHTLSEVPEDPRKNGGTLPHESPAKTSTPKSKESPLPPRLPAWSRSLPAHDALRLLFEGAPPPLETDAPRPRIRVDLLARRQKDKTFQPLVNGATLASRHDEYLLVVKPSTPGFLYVLQVDSRGKLFWLYPSNRTLDFSTGANPVAPNKFTQVPDESHALYLDNNAGVEHLYVVFSATRWKELEQTLERTATGNLLAAAVREPLGLSERGLERGPEGIRPIHPVKADVLKRVLDSGPVAPPFAAAEESARGHFLILERWFHHVESP